MSDQVGVLAKTLFETVLINVADAGRLSRGRAVRRDGGVVRFDVEPGRIEGQVQGSSREPYRVSISAPPSAWAMADPDAPLDVAALNRLIPESHRVRAECDCPDGYETCKHAVAVGYEFANRLAIDPELLRVWRSRPGAAAGTTAELGSPGAKGSRITSGASAPPVEPPPVPAPLSIEMRLFLGIDRPDVLKRPYSPLTPLRLPRSMVGPVDIGSVVEDALSMAMSVFGHGRV